MHDPGLIKGICGKFLKTDIVSSDQITNQNANSCESMKDKLTQMDLLQNYSSATSTPINCKSQFSSVNNSSLKKRDYK